MTALVAIGNLWRRGEWEKVVTTTQSTPTTELQPSDKNVFSGLKEGLEGIQLEFRNSFSTIFEYEMQGYLRMNDCRGGAKLIEICKTEVQDQED